MPDESTLPNAPTKKNKKDSKNQKQAIINEKIFGKSIEKSDPKEGITSLTIQASEIGNIPGTVNHWWHDLELRKKDIIEHANRTFIQRAVNKIMKDPLEAGTSGDELAKFHPLKKTEALVAELRAKPQDMLSRLELVHTIGQVNRTFPIEFYRAMLLQAMVACSFGEVSVQGLQIAVWAQNTYLQKLFSLCKDYRDKLQSNLDNIKNNEYSLRQRMPIEGQIKEVQRNIKILEAYQTHSQKVEEERIVGDWTVSLGEMQNVYLTDEENKKEKSNIIKKIAGMVDIIRYIILLHPVAHEMLDLFIKLENKNPIGYFLKARICMSAMVFSVGLYQGGERNEKTKHQVQENFKKAYHQYGLAMKKMGRVPQGTTHVSILIEYANIILYFYQIATVLLKIKLPIPWLQTALQRANKALLVAQESDKVDDLQKLLFKIVDAEKLDAEAILNYN